MCGKKRFSRSVESVKDWMRAEEEHVIARVVHLARRRGAERESEDIPSFKSDSGLLGGIAANCQMPLVKELLEVAPEAVTKTRQVEDF